MYDLDLEIDWIFLAVLAGVVANGQTDDWQATYQLAKIGAHHITAALIDDALEDELDALQKDTHGRTRQSD